MPVLAARDIIYTGDGYYYYTTPWYYVKWAIGAFLIFLAFLIAFAYIHAHRRVKQNKAPLAYHRWLIRRRNRHPEAYAQNQQPMYPYPPQQQQEGYYAPPPPAYHQHPQQPVYGGQYDPNKVDNTQAPTYHQQPHVQGESSTYHRP